MVANCLICRKHRGSGPLVGPVVWSDDQVIVTHRPPGDDGVAYLGYLFVETRRHVPAIFEMTGSEATAVARAAWLPARALRGVLAAELAFSAIIGRDVAHFHQHVFACYPGTPKDLRWTDVHEWAMAPRGDLDAVESLAAQLSAHIEADVVETRS